MIETKEEKHFVTFIIIAVPLPPSNVELQHYAFLHKSKNFLPHNLKKNNYASVSHSI